MVKKLLKTVFGHDNFRAFQEEAVEAILSNKDLLTILPTGGGKSLCYQLPSLVKDGTTVVISPLIALMHDQVSALKNNGIEAEMINSSQDYQEIQNITQKLVCGEIKLLYIAPERLSANGFIDLLHQININFFVIDEAHCVSEWGHEFRSDYRNLSKLKEIFPNVNISAFTATATKKVQEDIVNTLKLDNPIQLRGKTLRDNLLINSQKRVSNGRNQLLNFLQKHQKECGIIYAFSRKDVEKTAKFLQEKGYRADAYHAGLSSEVRSGVYTDFIYENIDIVVATIAFGMGIDKSNIRFVVHVSMPKTMENYYQEIGRAGRDGLPSETLLLYSKSDEIQRRMLIDNLQSSEYKNLMYSKLNKMYSFANSNECRHKKIGAYFDDELLECEDLCDSCNSQELESQDIKTQSMKLLSTIYRCEQRFGINHIIDVLRGSKSQKVYQFNHDKLSVYGIGEDLSKDGWIAVSERLFELEALDIGEFKATKITPIGLEILKGKIEVSIDKYKLQSIKKERKKDEILDVNDEIFEKFRELRREISSEQNVPAYIVFSDKTLVDFANKLPLTKDEALEVNGVGEVKFERYGERFLNLCIELKN
ncbi:MAG: DNA helicase RecQ [Sulfurimonas sp.]|nr:DNA helicase RecQ [Sulfurimonas sp.]